MRILIVEDEKAVRENIVDLLQRDSLEMVDVSNGLDGFQLLKKSKFDLIITDYLMPKMTGLDLLRICRDEGIHVPTICLTGKDNPELRKYAWEYGLYDYIEKSANTEEIIESVENFLSLKPEERAHLSSGSNAGVFKIPFKVIATRIHKTTYRGFREWCESMNKTPAEMTQTLMTEQ